MQPPNRTKSTVPQSSSGDMCSAMQRQQGTPISRRWNQTKSSESNQSTSLASICSCSLHSTSPAATLTALRQPPGGSAPSPPIRSRNQAPLHEFNFRSSLVSVPLYSCTTASVCQQLGTYSTLAIVFLPKAPFSNSLPFIMPASLHKTKNQQKTHPPVPSAFAGVTSGSHAILSIKLGHCQRVHTLNSSAP